MSAKGRSLPTLLGAESRHSPRLHTKMVCPKKADGLGCAPVLFWGASVLRGVAIQSRCNP